MTYSIIHTQKRIHTQKYIDSYCDVEKFIGFCKQCNKYNNCWSCPPYDFETIPSIVKYKYVYILGTKIILSESLRNSCRESEEQKKVGRKIISDVRYNLDKRLIELEKEYIGSKAFFAGTCHKCPEGECTRIKNLPCIYPDEIRHSLESFGFDIGKTSLELLEIELKWSNDGKLPEYFTLVSGFFTNSLIKGDLFRI